MQSERLPDSDESLNYEWVTNPNPFQSLLSGIDAKVPEVFYVRSFEGKYEYCLKANLWGPLHIRALPD